MRVRCPRCHRMASSRYPCKICGDPATMRHCHDRAHMNHASSARQRYPIGYQGERLTPTEDCDHYHPYDPITHLNEPSHKKLFVPGFEMVWIDDLCGWCRAKPCGSLADGITLVENRGAIYKLCPECLEKAKMFAQVRTGVRT